MFLRYYGKKKHVLLWVFGWQASQYMYDYVWTKNVVNFLVYLPSFLDSMTKGRQ